MENPSSTICEVKHRNKSDFWEKKSCGSETIKHLLFHFNYCQDKQKHHFTSTSTRAASQFLTDNSGPPAGVYSAQNCSVLRRKSAKSTPATKCRKFSDIFSLVDEPAHWDGPLRRVTVVIGLTTHLPTGFMRKNVN